MPRPNILLIHSDQHRYDCVGCNGHRQLQTPNLDRLAGEGVRFTHAFTPSPICSPARASLLTGQWPTQHGCVNIPGAESFRPMREGSADLFGLLSDAGYDIRFVGKFHQETAGPPTDYGVREFVNQNAYNAWRRERGYGKRPRENQWFGELDPGIPPEASRLAWGADTAIRMIEEAAAGDQPFMVRWDPSEPHLPCVVPEPYHSMYPPETIEPWPSFDDPLENKPYVQRLQRQRWGVEGWDWSQWAPVVSRYLGEIALLDAQVGRVLDALNRLGLAERTLVIYTTDHGDFCGGHGMMDKHFSAYDDIMRVPLLMRMPDRLPSGVDHDGFVCHSIDLTSTICAAAGVAPPDSFMGRDLLAEATGKGPAPRDDVFGMYQGCQMGLWSTRMVRDRRYKLVYHATERPELYDLDADPGELHNRADDPALRGERDRLSGRLLAWMESIDDPLLNGWTRHHITM